MENTFFTAKYPTHAVLWHVVQTGEKRPETDAWDVTVPDRDGNTIFVWFSIFATNEQMTRNVRDAAALTRAVGDTYKIIEL